MFHANAIHTLFLDLTMVRGWGGSIIQLIIWETGSEMLSNLPEITQLAEMDLESKSKSVGLH